MITTTKELKYLCEDLNKIMKYKIYVYISIFYYLT